MAEDAEKNKDAQVSEEQSEPEIEEVTVAPSKPKTSRSLRSRILNVRMLRRIVQVGFLLMINAYIFAAWFGDELIKSFWETFQSYLPTIPIISPLEAPFAVIAGSFDTLQREFSSGVFPFFTIGAMIIILTVLGRSACGWVCPVGTIQDFSTLPNPSKIRPTPGTENELRRVKAYIFVIVTFIAVWVGISTLFGNEEALIELLGPFAEAAFAPFNPGYILFVETVQWDWPTSFDNLWLFGTWGSIFWLQIVFLFILAIISFWIPRWFCRWICPAGWFYGIFSRDALLGIGRNPARCTPDVCNICEVVCPMNIRIRRFPYQHVYSPDCILCLECKSHCPNNAINLKFL
jgi:ferredoxin-type protein NapH